MNYNVYLQRKNCRKSYSEKKTMLNLTIAYFISLFFALRFEYFFFLLGYRNIIFVHSRSFRRCNSRRGLTCELIFNFKLLLLSLLFSNIKHWE